MGMLFSGSDFDYFFNEYLDLNKIKSSFQNPYSLKDGDVYKYFYIIPGVDISEISIEAIGNKLNITIDQKENGILGKILYKKSITFDPYFDYEHITSEYKNGILTISVPLRKEEKKENKPVKIAIQA